MTIEERMADFIVNINYDNLPLEVINAAKMSILDTIACAIGGSDISCCKKMSEMLIKQRGNSDSSILVYGNKVPPQIAALVNATMAHALDFDDNHDIALLHASVVAIPAALAISEYLGNINGKDFIAAIVAGIDISSRMGIATKSWLGWLRTPLYGFFGSAAVTSKLLNLDKDGILNAWGIAYAQAAGNLQCVNDGAETKRLQAGFASSGGVLAGLLAVNGISGAKNSMDGEFGIFKLYQRGDYDQNSLISEIGQKYEIVNISYKPYPCCRHTHASIDAALNLINKYKIEPDEINQITIGVNRDAYHNLCLPVEIKHKPRTTTDSQFSIPYVTAVALATNKVTIDDFSFDGIRRESVLKLTEKMSSYIDDEVDEMSRGKITAAKVIIRTKNNEYSCIIEFPKGHPKNPMSKGETKSKLIDCAEHASRSISKETLFELCEIIEKLEYIKNVAEIANLLRGN